MPYLGYIELALGFPKEFVEVRVEVPTLAFLVPVYKSLSQVIVVTNSLDVLYSNCIRESKIVPCSSLYVYQAGLKVLKARWRQTSSEALGTGEADGKSP